MPNQNDTIAHWFIVSEYDLKVISYPKNNTIHQIGAKAFHLAELEKHHFQIPETVFIPLSAYRTFVAANNLQNTIDTVKRHFGEGADFAILKPLLKELRAAFTKGDFPAAVLKILKETAARFSAVVAVRSSAVSEDSAAFSFAGQYHTVLSVEPDEISLGKAVKEVWTSQWNDAVAEYILKNKISSFEEGMGVIIQRMLRPQIAGVLFTRHPDSLSDEHIIIESVTGLAEKLVSGEATPQHFEIPRNAVPPELDKLFPLKFQKQFKELIRDALKIETLAKGAVDIEWAVENGAVYFLQYRTLTTGAEEFLWTNENVGEVIPDVVTPYSWSILKPVTNNAFARFLNVLSIKGFPEQGLFGLYKGRVYFNSTMFNRLLSGFYIGEQLKDKSPLGVFVFLVRKIPALIPLGLYLFLLPGKIKRYLRRFSGRLESIRFMQESDAALHLQKCDLLVKQHQRTMNLHLTCTIFAELYYQLLTKLCSGKETAAGPVSADALLSGIQGAESARSGRALWQLAKEISSDSNLQKIILDFEADEIEAHLSSAPGGEKMLEKIQAFLNEFGHGALHEFELFYPRWKEDKNFIYSNLKNYLINIPQLDWEAGQAEQTKKQATQFTEAAKSFSFLGRIFFYRIFNKALFFSVQRENLKQAFVKAHFELKKHLSVLAKLLNLADVRKILFLTDAEIADAFNGVLPVEQIKALIQAREKERSGYLKIKHPSKIRQLGEHWIPVGAEDAEPAQDVLRGIACSAGIAEGRARIILNPEDAVRIENGDILIARAVNPGWTPLFVPAAGIVSEIGGALSHGAIIAREYGLPMVAAVVGITTKIQDGQRIRLNGFSGTVEILEENE